MSSGQNEVPPVDRLPTPVTIGDELLVAVLRLLTSQGEIFTSQVDVLDAILMALKANNKYLERIARALEKSQK